MQSDARPLVRPSVIDSDHDISKIITECVRHADDILDEFRLLLIISQIELPLEIELLPLFLEQQIIEVSPGHLLILGACGGRIPEKLYRNFEAFLQPSCCSFQKEHPHP